MVAKLQWERSARSIWYLINKKRQLSQATGRRETVAGEAVSTNEGNSLRCRDWTQGGSGTIAHKAQCKDASGHKPGTDWRRWWTSDFWLRSFVSPLHERRREKEQNWRKNFWDQSEAAANGDRHNPHTHGQCLCCHFFEKYLNLNACEPTCAVIHSNSFKCNPQSIILNCLEYMFCSVPDHRLYNIVHALVAPHSLTWLRLAYVTDPGIFRPCCRTQNAFSHYIRWFDFIIFLSAQLASFLFFCHFALTKRTTVA